MRLASDNSWAQFVWSIWAGDRGELSCAHLNGEWQFHAKCHKLIGAFLACLSDWARGPLLLHDECAVSCCLVAGQLYLSCRFSSADSRCFQLSNCSLVSFVHHTALTDRDFKWKSHLYHIFMILLICLQIFSSRQFSKVK